MIFHHRNRLQIPQGIKTITLATTIRWIGFGFVEAILPIFVFIFANSYAEVGIFSATFDIFFLISLPLAGVLADKVAAKTIMIIGLLIYPFVGISYFLAGATGLALFIVLAKGINGISYAMDAVARSAYFMRHVAKEKISSTFGYFESVTTIWWIIAVISSIFLVKVFALHWLFLAIIPTHLIALYIIRNLKPDNHESLKEGLKDLTKRSAYLDIFKEVKDWQPGLKLIALLVFLLNLITPVLSLFVPIFSYVESGDISKSIILIAVMATPAVFGAFWGKIADKYKSTALVIGLGATSLLISSLILAEDFILKLLILFLIQSSLELVNLASDGIATRIIHPEHYGRLSSAMQGIGDIGSVIGPISIGLLIDSFGINISFSTTSIIVAIAMIIILARRKDLSTVPTMNNSTPQST